MDLGGGPRGEDDGGAAAPGRPHERQGDRAHHVRWNYEKQKGLDKTQADRPKMAVFARVDCRLCKERFQNIGHSFISSFLLLK